MNFSFKSKLIRLKYKGFSICAVVSPHKKPLENYLTASLSRKHKYLINHVFTIDSLALPLYAIVFYRFSPVNHFGKLQMKPKPPKNQRVIMYEKRAKLKARSPLLSAPRYRHRKVPDNKPPIL